MCASLIQSRFLGLNSTHGMKQNNKQIGSTFGGMMLGIILALLVVGGMLWFLNTQKSPFKPQVIEQKHKNTPVQSAQKVVVKPAKEDDLSRLIEDLNDEPLVNVAPHREVVVDKPAHQIEEQVVQIKQDERSPESILNGNAPVSVQKMLQIGSFSERTQAETQQAKLLMLNIKTQIQSASVQGKTVYRVYSGSLNEAEARSLQQKLHQQGMDSLLMNPR